MLKGVLTGQGDGVADTHSDEDNTLMVKAFQCIVNLHQHVLINHILVDIVAKI